MPYELRIKCFFCSECWTLLSSHSDETIQPLQTLASQDLWTGIDLEGSWLPVSLQWRAQSCRQWGTTCAHTVRQCRTLWWTHLSSYVTEVILSYTWLCITSAHIRIKIFKKSQAVGLLPDTRTMEPSPSPWQKETDICRLWSEWAEMTGNS